MTTTSIVSQVPSELLELICAHIYASGSSPPKPSLDPLLHSSAGVPTAQPSSYPPAQWMGSSVRNTLANLSLVNRAWSEAARPWLWCKVEVRMPRSWLALVEELAGGEDEDETTKQQAALIVTQTLADAESAAAAAKDLSYNSCDTDLGLNLREALLTRLAVPDSSIPPELLTPVVSRDPSPRRIREKSKSPRRWKLINSINVAVHDTMERAHGLHSECLLPDAITVIFDRSVQSQPRRTHIPEGSFDTLISIISGQSECAVLSKRALTTAS